jgi:hypothetical protein
MFPQDSQSELIESYYRFAILKEGKNLGVNMKKLRETMLDKYYEPTEKTDKDGKKKVESSLKDPKHDSYRSKLYAITDYVMFRQFGDSDDLQNMVNVLRETSNKAEKGDIYNDFSQSAWNSVKDILVPYYKKFNGSYPLFDSTLLGVNLDAAVAKLLNTNIPLVKLLSFLCNFLDGKEINELLSAYIHKFENIQSLINVLEKLDKDVDEKVKFTDKYALFNGDNAAGCIANQLRNIVSIGKMKGDLSDAKRPLFKAAIRVLGIEGLAMENDEEKFNAWLEENVLTGIPAKKSDCNPFRNFIAKQVIENRRFLYLARYTKPQTVRAVMGNKTVVKYVLSRLAKAEQSHDPMSIHESQIDKYYKDLGLTAAANPEQKIDALADKLSTLSFATLVDSKGKIKEASSRPGQKNREIEQLKALVKLYLTVAFIAIKNLVKTNARYYIAFSAWERDYHFFRKKLNKPVDDKDFPEEDRKIKPPRYANYLAMTEYLLNKDEPAKAECPNADKKGQKKTPEEWKAFRAFLKSQRGKNHFTSKWREILRSEIDEANGIHNGLQSWARNQAEHLNVLTALPKYIAGFTPRPMTSYFQLYHYILQRWICDDPEAKDAKLGDLPDNLKKFHSPVWDYVKYFYVSLAYNLPRYKNLTIEALFDDDSDGGKELQKKREEKEKKREEKRK